LTNHVDLCRVRWTDDPVCPLISIQAVVSHAVGIRRISNDGDYRISNGGSARIILWSDRISVPDDADAETDANDRLASARRCTTTRMEGRGRQGRQYLLL
jgi:hypothetical protein